MKLFTPVLGFFVLAAAVSFAGPKREEAIFLFENRKVAVAVPDGFGFSSNKDDLGLMNLQIAAPQDKLTMHVVFVPDPEGQFANARTRKEKMVELFQEYVESSTEKGMQFEELEPKVGVGTYCAFTDASLKDKTTLARGEFLHVTAGVKVWPGVVAIFRLFSHDVTSVEYQSAMKLLRESLQEKTVPLK